MFNISKSILFLKKILSGSNFAISYSGGIDSSILLKATYNIKGCMLIHINHGLDKQSLIWEKKCKSDAIKYKLNIKVIRIKLNTKYIKDMGLEGACRLYRYRAISDYLRNNNIRYLVTGHNLDDLVETFLINVFRGCGLFGLKPINTVSFNFGIFIIRPFINIPRADLFEFFKPINNHIIDKSNFSFRFKRNVVRFVLSNYISVFFRKYMISIRRTTYLIYDYIKFLYSVAKEDISNTNMLIYKIRKLPNFRIRNIIIYILRNNGFGIKSMSWLNEVVKQVLSCKSKMLITNKNVRITLEKETLTFLFN
ncbi:tRNA lysidine(34) synthetase TilS [Candidatus Vidania fulgoroideae]|uniref:tRNA(Ile)-lysidine synthase n=1 Tax=Candidatus Vidania fulgoroideorum TaxID=881286 RepID=A0A975AEQ6_9PROT|nr:tRNA lysidine(34) synthetase TilS [Candidatus Vidania fulgoroideae]